MINSIIETIKAANPERSLFTTKRRLLKIGEEKGEVCEALLNVTSSHNMKHKSWDDVREELVDCFIVAVDIALTFNSDMTFDFHIRHIDKYNEDKFTDKILITDHLLSSLGYVLNHIIKEKKSEGEDGHCISKSMAILFFELATLIFPDKNECTEEEIFTAFSSEVNRKLAKWLKKREENGVV
jgi:NTP pyrophosphatase (non-canonical NTP hydrolase)